MGIPATTVWSAALGTLCLLSAAGSRWFNPITPVFDFPQLSPLAITPPFTRLPIFENVAPLLLDDLLIFTFQFARFHFILLVLVVLSMSLFLWSILWWFGYGSLWGSWPRRPRLSAQSVRRPPSAENFTATESSYQGFVVILFLQVLKQHFLFPS